MSHLIAITAIIVFSGIFFTIYEVLTHTKAKILKH